MDLCYPEIDVTSNNKHSDFRGAAVTRPDASALEDSLFVAEFFARCPLRAAFVRDMKLQICKKVEDFLGKINFTRGKPAKTGH